MEIISYHRRSKNVLQLRNQLQTLRKLIKKITVDNLKQRDVNFFYFHLKRLLTALHLLLHFEILNIESSKFIKKTYINFLFKRTNKVLYKSKFLHHSSWSLVITHGSVDIDSRALIRKISSILAFSSVVLQKK